MALPHIHNYINNFKGAIEKICLATGCFAHADESYKSWNNLTVSSLN